MQMQQGMFRVIVLYIDVVKAKGSKEPASSEDELTSRVSSSKGTRLLYLHISCIEAIIFTVAVKKGCPTQSLHAACTATVAQSSLIIDFGTSVIGSFVICSMGRGLLP
jgi:hypothetical protein